MSMKVIQPGLLSLIQDAGRFGAHGIGLTTGGPLDAEAFYWANRLCGNDLNATAIEASFGGLQLEAQVDTYIAVTGAESGLKLNGQPVEQWRSHRVKAGDKIELGFPSAGTRAYVAVAGGFHVDPQFGSTATVVREGIGGLAGDKLRVGDELPCEAATLEQALVLAEDKRPQYSKEALLRVIPGYQQHSFSRIQQRIFFCSEYTVSDRCDRMGFRLEGPQVKSSIDGILSEGICMGAIQIPADGQPIVLMNDRQTIGGYPKIGSVLSLDTAKLAQMMPGGKVHFEPVTLEHAHNEHALARSRFLRTELEVCDQ